MLRVDRTTASHGLEVREPFLDLKFIKHYFSLPANIKCPRNGIEKYHLRKALEVTYPGILPTEILWRQNFRFYEFFFCQTLLLHSIPYFIISNLKVFRQNNG